MVQVDVCNVRFVEDVHYTQLIEHAHSSVTSSAEQPTCPVCLGMSRILINRINLSNNSEYNALFDLMIGRL